MRSCPCCGEESDSASPQSALCRRCWEHRANGQEDCHREEEER